MPLAVIVFALILLGIPVGARPSRTLGLHNYGTTEVLVSECGWAPEAEYWPSDVEYLAVPVNNSAELSEYARQTFRSHALGRLGGIVYRDEVLQLQIINNSQVRLVLCSIAASAPCAPHRL